MALACKYLMVPSINRTLYIYWITYTQWTRTLCQQRVVNVWSWRYRKCMA